MTSLLGWYLLINQPQPGGRCSSPASTSTWWLIPLSKWVKHPNYKWINPTYPIYNWGYNPLTIRGMSHQVPGEHIHADDVLQLTWQELVRSNLQAPARQLRGHLLVPAMSDLEAQGDPRRKSIEPPKKLGRYPNSWMVNFMENPWKKWRIWGTPMDWKPPNGLKTDGRFSRAMPYFHGPHAFTRARPRPRPWLLSSIIIDYHSMSPQIRRCTLIF